jgi:hypothetical protein
MMLDDSQKMYYPLIVLDEALKPLKEVLYSWDFKFGFFQNTFGVISHHWCYFTPGGVI